jgi:hypothetical protein
MELVYILLCRKGINQYAFVCVVSISSLGYSTKFVRFSFMLIIVWNIMISNKKESTNASFLFVKSQNCGVRT